jgi:hypothetical protein
MFDKGHCSPHNNETNSCIPKKGLVKIAKILNNKYECSINHNCSKKKLHNSITNEIKGLSKCNKEACWLNIEDIKKGFKFSEYEKLKEYFRPFMPDDWKNDPKKWLNTTDINNVMDQYELQYPKFKYMGASPIDYHLKSNSGECIVNELCSLDLNEIEHDNYESIGVVFNTDPHNQSGQHWFSVFIDLKGKNRKNKPTIYHFDSAAGEPTEEILNLVNDVKTQYKDIHGKEIDFLFNDKKHQSENTECGIYCLHFLVYMLQGKNFKKYANKKKTDKAMHKFRDKFYIQCGK